MPRIGAGRPEDFDDWNDEAFPQVERVRDVLVIPSPGHRANEQEWLDNPPVNEPVDLGSGMFIERLRGDPDGELAEEVIQASMPRGLNHDTTRQFGQLYSFWRDVPADERDPTPPLQWDSSQAFPEVIALSRFVLDNAHGFEFAGRVIVRDDGHRRIVPLYGHDGRAAYRSRRDRFWFTTGEAETLRILLDLYRAVKDDLPDRVGRALWHADRSSYSRYINEALTNIATGLEALLNTGEDEPITAQFTKRSKQLADELGFETSRTYWNWVYEARSRIVHGDESTLVAPIGWDESDADPPLDVQRVAKAQDVLRAAIRRAIEDAQFRAAFESEETIRARFPLEAPAGTGATG